MLNGEASFHLHRIGSRSAERAPLPGDATADVCILGAGFTGLWTAWWLRQSAPERSIVVIEAERVGFGASGRNLGWLSGKPVGDRRRLAEGPGGAEGPIALRRACIKAVTEIPALMRDHGVDIEARHAGYVQYARTPAAMERVRVLVEDRASWRLDENDLRLLSQSEVAERARVEGALGGLFSPHCASIQPAKLAAGLAKMVEAAGVTIHERTAALRIAPGAVTTNRGTVRAQVVLRATEAFSSALPDCERSIVPLRSSAIVTEPLSAAQWDAIGWRGGEALYGAEHVPLFTSKTLDGRIIVAGRGFPYPYGSHFDASGRIAAATIEKLEQGLKSIFPAVSPKFAHAWCGMYGVPRDWAPSVNFDPRTGLGVAGGYGGQGVAASYLAGHTLADLVAALSTRWTRLPWTNRASPKWEGEPLRWIGARAAFHLYRLGDAAERRSQSFATSGFAQLARKISGRP
jgi:glycine/D-amino acid oxidase-like deaminating enzyme